MTDGVRYPFPDPPDFGQPREVARGVEWLRLPLPTKLDHVNCWILGEEDGVTVVDTGSTAAGHAGSGIRRWMGGAWCG